MTKRGWLAGCNQIVRRAASFQSSSTSSASTLKLFNSFTRDTRPVVLNNNQIELNRLTDRKSATAYVCGPTVYDESHLGHAVTYLRFDLFRRILKAFCSIDLVTVMNVTDVDDKIITRANREKSTSREIADKYLDRFLFDMHSLNVQSPDALIRVTDKIDVIIKFIQSLERRKKAYINPITGDVCIKSNEIDEYQSKSNSSFQSDSSLSKSTGKQSPEDFVLWKTAKPNEPFWTYESVENNSIQIQGRPGWHVECSAIATEALGENIDFHFGGQDLLFPHHLNESACCFANTDVSSTSSSSSIHSWCSNWIHFGQFIIKNQKMSKSLGNGISIRQFLADNRAEALRVICLMSSYKRDIYYDESFLKKANQIYQKLLQFQTMLQLEVKSKCSSTKQANSTRSDISWLIDQFNHENLNGIANDMNYSAGFSSILDLIDSVTLDLNKLTLLDLVRIQNVTTNYLQSIGLLTTTSSNESNLQTQRALSKLIDFRSQIRTLGLNNLKVNANKEMAKQLLINCDQIREQLKKDELFIVDKKV